MKGQSFKAEAGQFVTSLPSIVKKCGRGVTTQNVRTALKRFEKYEFLIDESTNKNRLITILNWDIYQETKKVGGDLVDNSGLNESEKSTDGSTTEISNGNPVMPTIVVHESSTTNSRTNRQLTANKNVRMKEGKKEVIKDNVADAPSIASDDHKIHFEKWWNLYGNKKDRKKCIAKYKLLLKKYSHEQMMTGTNKYLDYRKKLVVRGEFLPQQKNPLPFLNGENFNDEYEMPIEGRNEAPKTNLPPRIGMVTIGTCN